MDDYKKLLADCKDYIQTRYDLLRLELLDKLSQILGLIVLIIVALILVMGALAYFSVALVHLMSQVMPVSVACLILGCVLLIILLILYLNKEKIFINPFIRILSSLFFENPASAETDVQTGTKEVSNETHE